MNLKSEITKLHYSNVDNSLALRERAWGEGAIFALLRFCSFFYGLGSGFKNFLYDRGFLKPKKVDAFVISVGNFTTGGVGKTPVVAEIAKYFVDKGERVAIISRGYGGKLNNKKVNVISDGVNLYYKADMAGDEPYWLAVNLNMCAVLTCSNRVKAAEYAIKQLRVTKIILDDGFQHRKMARDLDIVLVDSEKMFGNENLLPAGPLREKPDFKRVSKLVIVSKNIDHTRAEKLAKIMTKKLNLSPRPAGATHVNQRSVDNCETTNSSCNSESTSTCNSKSSAPLAGEVARSAKGGYSPKVLVAKVEPDYAYNIITGEHLPKGAKVTALSAIGQPEQFYAFLKDYDVKEKITFDDHHQYSQADISNIEGNIITTEKDAVKLALLERADIYALKLKTVLDIEKLCYNSEGIKQPDNRA